MRATRLCQSVVANGLQTSCLGSSELIRTLLIRRGESHQCTPPPISRRQRELKQPKKKIITNRTGTALCSCSKNSLQLHLKPKLPISLDCLNWEFCTTPSCRGEPRRSMKLSTLNAECGRVKTLAACGRCENTSGRGGCSRRTERREGENCNSNANGLNLCCIYVDNSIPVDK